MAKSRNAPFKNTVSPRLREGTRRCDAMTRPSLVQMLEKYKLVNLKKLKLFNLYFKSKRLT